MITVDAERQQTFYYTVGRRWVPEFRAFLQSHDAVFTEARLAGKTNFTVHTSLRVHSNVRDWMSTVITQFDTTTNDNPTAAEVRAWARLNNYRIGDRGVISERMWALYRSVATMCDDVRSWARKNGYDVSVRGHISGSVWDAHRAATLTQGF